MLPEEIESIRKELFTETDKNEIVKKLININQKIIQNYFLKIFSGKELVCKVYLNWIESYFDNKYYHDIVVGRNRPACDCNPIQETCGNLYVSLRGPLYRHRVDITLGKKDNFYSILLKRVSLEPSKPLKLEQCALARILGKYNTNVLHFELCKKSSVTSESEERIGIILQDKPNNNNDYKLAERWSKYVLEHNRSVRVEHLDNILTK
ncbi:MAG: hypothetical protein MJ227_00860 [Bacilli bacterium]|nr:hypothetical protein [Bacilli bacterium]